MAKGVLFAVILAFFIYFNIANWHSRILGLILALFYFFFISSGAQMALANFFNLSGNAFRIKILGILFGLTTLSLIVEFEIIFFRLTAVAIALAFFLNAIIYIILDQLAPKEDGQAEIDNENLSVIEEVPHAKIGLLLYVALALYGFYLLHSSQTGAAILTPWQTINPKFIYVFLSATLILGFLIFSKLKAKSVLFLLVIHSFLMLSYLPLTHQLIYGADSWRHIATESQLIAEKPLDLVVYGQQNFLNKLNLGQFSYSQLWGVSVISARLFNSSFLSVNVWLGPIAWAIFMPILLFEIGMAMGFAKKRALFFAWLGFLPFALVTGGAFTLPNNWGFLAWLFFSLLLLKRLAAPKKGGQAVILILLAIPILFGYGLYSILMILTWAIAEILVLQKLIPQNFKFKNLLLVGAVGLSLPIIELLAGYSQINRLNWFEQIKQFIGNFTSYYLASGPRPHDIATGNIIFNQVPSYAFVENILTQGRWWLLIFMLVFLGGAVYGLVSFWKSEKTEQKWLAMFFSGLFTGYFICLYLLGGEHIITRRLDAVIAVCLLVLFLEAWTKLVWQKLPGILAIPISVIIFSFAITTSYSLGPDTNSVSKDQFDAMNYIWQAEQGANKYCVVADTYPLLALEAISNKAIIGGGFPIDQNFAQPERAALFAAAQKRLTNGLLADAHVLTGADYCWFLSDFEIFKNLGLLQGPGYVRFGDSVILRYNLK